MVSIQKMDIKTSWSEIEGQEQAIRCLRQALASQRVHHAYLLEGPEGVGKKTCARLFFAALNCMHSSTKTEACGHCLSCHKIQTDVHPDWKYVPLVSAGLAEQMDQVIQCTAMPPHEGRVRMVVLDPVDVLAGPGAHVAANRLLKTLEEPPSHTQFVLLGQSAQMLLPTLRSRIQRIHFHSLPDHVVEKQLSRAFPSLAREKQLLCIRYAQGSLGKALTLAEQPESLTSYETGVQWIWKTLSGFSSEWTLQLPQQEVFQDRDRALFILQTAWLRGATHLAHLSQETTPSVDLLHNLKLLLEAIEAIRRFTSPLLAIERLLRCAHPGLSPLAPE